MKISDVKPSDNYINYSKTEASKRRKVDASTVVKEIGRQSFEQIDKIIKQNQKNKADKIAADIAKSKNNYKLDQYKDKTEQDYRSLDAAVNRGYAYSISNEMRSKKTKGDTYVKKELGKKVTKALAAGIPKKRAGSSGGGGKGW